MIDKQKLIEICDKIHFETTRDAIEFNEKPFDGRTINAQIAEYFGNQGAAICALAIILKQILEDDTNKSAG